MASFFERFRLLLWTLAAAVIGFYIYGLFLGLYGPLELGLLSVLSLFLIVLFTIHELRLRREPRRTGATGRLGWTGRPSPEHWWRPPP